MKKVYICSPCSGDYENDILRAKEYSRAAVEKGVIPVTPHIYLTQFMDDNVPEERELALKIGSVTLHLPAFRAMAVCNQHLDHGPISIELDGSVILELADRLISDPGVHIEIGG